MSETRQRSRHKLAKVACATAVVIALSLCAFLWALYASSADCSQPACARQRFSLQIELARFERVPPIPLEVNSVDGPVSVQSVLASGGISTQVTAGKQDLPLANTSGKLDRADLYAFAQAWRNPDAPHGADANLYAMLVPGIISDSGEDLFGLMFDAADRQGFALAPAEVAVRFGEQQPQAVQLLQLRIFIHELLHTLNRRHSQAAQMADLRLTIEAPTKCIARDTSQFDWSLREQPLMALSPDTIRFFQSAPVMQVLPGPNHEPFLIGSTSTCRDVRATVVEPSDVSRWRFAVHRLKGALGWSTAQAQGAQRKRAAASLTIQAMTAVYPLGYPVTVRVAAVNRGDSKLPLIGRLLPGYQMVRIETRSAPDGSWSTLQPIAWYETISDDAAMLAPGERTEQSVPIFFNKDHWTFAAPGTYEVRARLRLDEGSDDIMTQPITIRVEEPVAPRDRQALQLLRDTGGHLRNDVGRQLLLSGRVHDPVSDALIDQLAERYGDTAVGSAVQLTRAARLLRHPIDPLTGERVPPDLDAARELMAESCSDSGIAALRQQLLDFQRTTTGSQPAPMPIESPQAAWDGSVPLSQPPMATYSDSRLSVAGQTFHFCRGRADLRGAPVLALRDLASELRQLGPDRIVIVGHAADAGSCGLNDALAMRRAQTVRVSLIRAGIAADRIQVVSLGQRRPLDFSVSEAANQLNRRVEILIPTAIAAALKSRDPQLSHVLPDCGS